MGVLTFNTAAGFESDEFWGEEAPGNPVSDGGFLGNGILLSAVGTDATISLDEDTTRVLSTADFGYSDPENDPFAAVRIDALPTAGALLFDSALVGAGQVIDAADVAAGRLTFTPTHDANGTGYASLHFSVSDGTAFDATPNTLTFDVTAVNDAPTFAVGDGIVAVATVAQERAFAGALQPDGKLLVTGSSDGRLAVWRYLPDGSLDPTFGTNGAAIYDVSPFNPAIGNPSGDEGHAIHVLDDGRILVGGKAADVESGFASGDMVVVRLNADGSLDATFDGDTNGNGIVRIEFGTSTFEAAFGMAVQDDGSIVLAGGTGPATLGAEDFAVVRLTADGSLDVDNPAASHVGFSGDGKTSFSLFASGGQEVAYDVVLQGDGKIVVAGESRFEFGVARLNPDGSLDTGFSGDGLIRDDINREDYAHSVLVQPDGKILVAGYSEGAGSPVDPADFTLTRYNTDGTPDTTFSGDGRVTHAFTSTDRAYAVALTPNGNILVAGRASFPANASNGIFVLYEYDSSGTLLQTFGQDIVGTEDVVNDLIIAPDGRIILIGDGGTSSSRDVRIMRLGGDIQFDATFDPVNTLGGTAAFTDHGAATVLDPNVSIYDAELSAQGHYDGATLALTRHGSADSKDFFGASGALSFVGNDVILSGVTIATLSQAAPTLVLTFNSNATQARVDEALRLITYGKSLVIADETLAIDWIFGDGNAGAQGPGGPLSTIGTTTVNITNVVTDVDVPGSSPADQGLATAEDEHFTGIDLLNPAKPKKLVTYIDSPAGVQVNLAMHTIAGSTASGGFAEGDFFTDINFVAGSNFVDQLIGDGFANTLIGYDGADTLSGADGNDVLDGGLGADTLSGGEGDDALIFDGDDVLSGGNGNDYAVVGDQSGPGVAMAFTQVMSIETVLGGDGDDTFNASGMAGSRIT
ncbi:MAG: hypothetical protein R3D27_12870, partial [Hyphomicrobiaceae bacterium]